MTLNAMHIPTYIDNMAINNMYLSIIITLENATCLLHYGQCMIADIVLTYYNAFEDDEN